MSKIILFLFILITPFILKAQKKNCISGDCENGLGTAEIKIKKSKKNHIRYNSIIFYTGNFKNGLFEGQGEFKKIYNKDTLFYKGEFKAGKFDGEGVYKYVRSTFTTHYTGGFRNEKFNGKGECTHIMKTGEIFYLARGTYVNDYLQGYAEVVTDEYTIKRDYKPNNEPGFCVKIYKDGSSYRGFINDDGYTGYGQLIVNNRTYYAGQYENNKEKGFRVYCNENGDWYIGAVDYITQRYIAKVIYAGEENKYYIGHFKNGVPAEPGVMWKGDNAEFKYIDPSRYSNDPAVISFKKTDYGCVTQNCKSGFGIYRTDSISLTGYFDSEGANGFGVWEFLGGVEYYGYFKDNAPKSGFSILRGNGMDMFGYCDYLSISGEGMIIYEKNHSVYFGGLKDNRPDGYGWFVDLEGNIKNRGRYENGVFLGE